jgi:hypothetical protein
MKTLEKAFIKALRRHGAEQVLSRLTRACGKEGDRLRERYFHLPSRRLLNEVTTTQCALIGAKDEVRRELRSSRTAAIWLIPSDPARRRA